MAEAPVDPSETDLEQSILRVLREAGSPVKTAQLVKECQVPKKKLNQVIYRLKAESQVALVGPGTWCLGDGGTGEVVPAEGAQPSQAERPQQGAVTIPERPGSLLSEQQKRIYRFLEARGPCKALIIAQSLGLRTAKEVNPDLYALRIKHLVDYDQNSNVWKIYQPEVSGGGNQSTTIIYQQNPTNVISQNGPNSHISIKNSAAIQIGHRNTILSQTASGENGPTAPLNLPLLASTDPSTQDPLDGSWVPQDIRMENSELRRVQLGHGNEMSLHSTPTEGPACSPSGRRPVFATTGSEASFKMRMPTPGHSKGDVESVAQRVHIRSCFLEDAAIGNHNRMRVITGAAEGGGAGPEDSDGDPGEPAGDARPHTEAAQHRGNVPDNEGPTDADISMLTSHLEAVTLEGRDLEATEDTP
ncbi:Z-DNA binding protein 1 [Rhinolophus ferrumequinum]|uniref:Z-DNA-binding protein 1 n=1 Tax=Rhinolophus ferrumequinum TaxID=59479 RepID=A0A671G382_RHIFE|nr:Z-DNA-binding protein 1 isoform X2 [Rhinolophus ferrumequinum]KAF6285087.1 Z-DNA binding protein 1 [Rhinolophus ferrumequinum]